MRKPYRKMTRQEKKREAVANTFRKPPKPYTYIVEAPGLGLVKIGRSKDLRSRLDNLQASNAHPLVLRRKISGLHHEKILHEKLDRFRQHGEWFALTPELRDFVNRYHRSDPDFYPL